MEGGGGEEGVHLHQISISNTTSGKSFRLIPRWESCVPRPEAGRELVTFGKPTASLPASEDSGLRLAPSLTEVNKLVISFEACGALCSIPLVQCKSRLASDRLPSVEGNVYINLEVYPEDGRTSLRLYELFPGPKNWVSTGFYFLELMNGEDEVRCPDLGHDKCPEQTLGNKPMYFHGKGTAEISLPPLKVNFERDFTFVKRIGKGTEGTVSRCISKFSSYSSAVKKTDLGNLFVTSTSSEPREVTVLSMLMHNNIIVPYLAWNEMRTSRYTSEVGCAFLSMQICERSLVQYLNERAEIDLESNLYIFRQILEGVKFMHENGIMHRDIKPANILIEPNLTVKLVDFGIAKLTASGENSFESAGGVYGSLPYCAPELGNQCTPHDEMVDIFSAGIVYCELFLPCRKKHRQGQSRWIRAHAKESEEKLMLLHRNIRARAKELDCELLGRKFNLDDALKGTNILENWTGDLALLKRMISPKASERLSALELLDFFDKEVPDNRDGTVGL